jgi:hypothetical protein
MDLHSSDFGDIIHPIDVENESVRVPSGRFLPIVLLFMKILLETNVKSGRK